MRKKKVKVKRRAFPKAIRELAKDPIFAGPKKMLFPCDCTKYNGGQCYNCLNGAHDICGDGRGKCSMTKPSPERRKGHSALRYRDGRLEIFDPNPGTDDSTPETDAFTRDHARTAAEWYQFCKGIEQRLRVAQREYKKGWDAFYRLRRSVAQKDYPTLTQVVRPA